MVKKKLLWLILFLGFALIIFLFLALIRFNTFQGYKNKTIPFRSSLAQSLAIFNYNQSQHPDEVPNCWYDSGDYLVFLPRNVETLFYLSLAYRFGEDDLIKADLKTVIDRQLICAESMLEKNIKQFRDQDSHGVPLPPKWNHWLKPDRKYFFRAGEGGDVFLLLSLIHQNMGDQEKAILYKERTMGLNVTSSDHCCELGPLVLQELEWKALQTLAHVKDTPLPEHIWGLQFTSLLMLEKDQFAALKGLFAFLEKEWKGDPWPFEYLGGNYDIAGTIALERLYAKETGDHSYKALSDGLYAYLSGQNKYGINFTQTEYVYHPCYFFRVCSLDDTLVNGIHKQEQKKVDHDWQTSEVQLVGQAQYVLMKVLYLD